MQLLFKFATYKENVTYDFTAVAENPTGLGPKSSPAYQFTTPIVCLLTDTCGAAGPGCICPLDNPACLGTGATARCGVSVPPGPGMLLRGACSASQTCATPHLYSLQSCRC